MAKEEAKTAVKALEQQPYADTISRLAAIKAATQDISDKRTHGFNAGVTRAANRIKLLPPVLPQPKTGHWIFDDECKEHGHCSHCGYGSVDLVDGEPHNFCRKCGAWMVEPQTERDTK